MDNIIEQEKQKRCFYCEKLNAYLTATACLDNQKNADPYNGKRHCLNCEMGKKVKELVQKAKKWKWGIQKIGNCSECKKFTLIKDSDKWLCPACYYKLNKKNKKEEKMNNEKNKKQLTISLDFTEYQELYHKLVEEAQKQFRPIKMQILFIIDRFFNNKE